MPDIPAPSFLSKHKFNNYSNATTNTSFHNRNAAFNLKGRRGGGGGGARRNDSSRRRHSSAASSLAVKRPAKRRPSKTPHKSASSLSDTFINKLRDAEWIASLSEYKLDMMRMHDDDIEIGLQLASKKSTTASKSMPPTTRAHNKATQQHYHIDPMVGSFRPHYVRNSSSVSTTGRTVMDQYLDSLYLKHLISHQDELKMAHAHRMNSTSARAATRVSARNGVAKHKQNYHFHSIHPSPNGVKDNSEDPSSRLAVHSIVAPNCVLRRNSDIPRRALKSASSSRRVSQMTHIGQPFAANEVGSHPPHELRSKSSYGYSGRKYSVTRNKENNKPPLQIPQVPLPVLKLGDILPESPQSVESPPSSRRTNHFTNISPEPFSERQHEKRKRSAPRSKSQTVNRILRISQPNFHHQSRLTKTPKLSVIRASQIDKLKDSRPPLSKSNSESTASTEESESSTSNPSSIKEGGDFHPLPSGDKPVHRRAHQKRASTARGGMPAVEEGILSPRIQNHKSKNNKKKSKKRKPQEIELNVSREDQLLSGWNLNLSGDGLHLSPRENST
eukprot:CAMPEP_0117446930 /NCGR_PEP_ID=MMETSP0759-20121206/6604_1 /TAXON_ID=63605 /ORGANISM="Percolomonas cosmopolitus, Strain WS" /LENGTH=557 /DNA_ID=CAMNT_0005239231 /DNA_START=206 /DNA_END=1875 /DNA_ORIENTATION=+